MFIFCSLAVILLLSEGIIFLDSTGSAFCLNINNGTF